MLGILLCKSTYPATYYVRSVSYGTTEKLRFESECKYSTKDLYCGYPVGPQSCQCISTYAVTATLACDVQSATYHNREPFLRKKKIDGLTIHQKATR